MNGNNFWANESFNPGVKGKIVLQKVNRIESGRKTWSLKDVFVWMDSKGVKLVTDSRKMTFHSHPTMRIIDYEILLKAIETAKFGDTHEGSFGVRVPAWLEEPAPKYVPLAKGQDARPTEPPRTGKISDAEGRETEAQVRGKRANWADYSGEVKGEKLGIAANIFAGSDLGNDKTHDGNRRIALPLSRGHSSRRCNGRGDREDVCGLRELG
jgi:hypothetical protein